MRILCVVKGGAADQLEGELTLHDAHSADDAVVLRVFPGWLDRHEIGDLTNALMREKARDQDIRFWQIILLVLKKPPLSASSRDPKLLGASKAGKQHQSMVPFVPTSATVCRSPMSPWSSMGRYLSNCR